MNCKQALTLEQQITQLLQQRGYSSTSANPRNVWKKAGMPDFEFATSCAAVSYRLAQSGHLISIRKEGAVNKLMDLL